MRTVNRIFIAGHLGADPEVRITSSGRTITRLSVATHRRVRKGEDWSKVTDWHKVVVFDWQARVCGDKLRKGDSVIVVGELRYRRWTDGQDVQRTMAEIVAQDVTFLGTSPSDRPQPTMELPNEPVTLSADPTLVPEESVAK